MKVEVKEIEQLVKELSIEVPADAVNSKMEEKFIEIKNSVTLKGYRKGKAPLSVIKSLYHDEVKADIAEDLIKATYPEAVKENTLKVASYPTVTSFNFNDDGSIKYTATVEVFPEIEKVAYENIEVKAPGVDVSDEEVNEVVETLRKRKSELRPLDREIKDTDVVVVDIEKVFDPGNVIPQDKFENSEVDLGNKLTVKEFKESLPGMKIGDEKEIEVKYAEDYPDKTFAGAHLKYKTKVKEVKERILPELNDGFAKSVEIGETLLEMKIKIRERLTEQKNEEQKRDKKSQVITQICQKNEIPIPKAMVSEYLNNVVEDFKKQYKDVDEAEIRKNYESIGVNTIRWNMLMHHIAEQEKIEVLPEDTEKLIKQFADNYNMTMEQARESIQKSGNIADVRETILEDKVVDFLLGKANIIEADK